LITGKGQGTGCYEKDVRRALHDPSGQIDGVLYTLDGGHRAGCQCPPFHDGRIELDLPVTIQDGAASRIECRVGFHEPDRFGNAVERSPTAGEHIPAYSHRLANTLAMRLELPFRYRPRTAVDQDDSFALQAQPFHLSAKKGAE
jgi:hypothetical protein